MLGPPWTGGMTPCDDDEAPTVASLLTYETKWPGPILWKGRPKIPDHGPVSWPSPGAPSPSLCPSKNGNRSRISFLDFRPTGRLASLA